MKLFRNTFLLVFGLTVAGLLAYDIRDRVRHLHAREYRTFLSPDGRFKIVVKGVPMVFAFPGQSGDAPGFVQLCTKSGKVLQEKEVEMVQMVDNVQWSPSAVNMDLFAEWNLPK